LQLFKVNYCPSLPLGMEWRNMPWPGDIVLFLNGDPVQLLPPKKWTQQLSLLGSCLLSLWPNCRPAQQLLSSCLSFVTVRAYTTYREDGDRLPPL